MTYTPIKELKVGDKLTQIFMIADIETRSTKKGKTYGRLTLKDKKAQITTNIWDFDPREYPEIKSGTFVSMSVEVEEFRGEKNATSREIPMPVDTPADLSEYHDDRGLSIADADDCWKLLMSFKDSVKNVFIRAFLDVIFDNPEVKKRFKHAPASATNRGAYRGGLVEHVLKVMRNADFLLQSQATANNPAPINRDIVIAGVLCHDLGKMYSYKVDHTGASTTTSGRLIGHLVQSYSITVQAFIQTESVIRQEIPEAIKDHINHCILSHHGRLEWGSPVTPISIEAQVVHQADVADCSISNFAEPIVDKIDEKNDDGFVPGDGRFNSRFIYVDGS